MGKPSDPPVRSEDIALIVHDIRSPLAVIAVESTLLARELENITTEEIRRGLRRIANSAGYIDRLVSDLLDLASADARRLELAVELVDLSRLLEEAIGHLVPAPARGRIALAFEAWPTVRIDIARIERVLSNLVGNALKFAPPGTPIVVRVDYPRDARFACVSVIDEGPGLTPEQVDGLFRRFHRIETTDRQPGYGLGLYISRIIVEAHGGRIGVESTAGAGSRFFFELPVS